MTRTARYIHPDRISYTFHHKGSISTHPPAALSLFFYVAQRFSNPHVAYYFATIFRHEGRSVIIYASMIQDMACFRRCVVDMSRVLFFFRIQQYSIRSPVTQLYQGRTRRTEYVCQKHVFYNRWERYKK